MKAENLHECQRNSRDFKTPFVKSPSFRRFLGMPTLALFIAFSVGCTSKQLHSNLPTEEHMVSDLSQERAQPSEWNSDGIIVISRLSPAPQSLSPETLLGFFPGSLPTLTSGSETQEARSGKWLVIDRASNKMVLQEDGSNLLSLAADGLERLPVGTFSVILKQRGALWHAPDRYFTARNLPIPPVGDLDRFLKGALGEFVVFIDKETPLHSGPVASEEIGGIRLEESDLARIYYQIEPGTPVEIK